MGFHNGELVQLWRSRVQHLKLHYQGWKPKQKGKAVISCHIWYFPLLMMLWLTAMSTLTVLGLNVQGVLDIVALIQNMNLVLNLNLPGLVFWWRFAVIQSAEHSTSRHYNSKLCYSDCAMCAHPHFRGGSGKVLHRTCSDGTPITMVVPPLKHRCRQMRRVHYIIHHDSGPPEIQSQLLLLSGDVETNPGPEYEICIADLEVASLHTCLNNVLDWDRKEGTKSSGSDLSKIAESKCMENWELMASELGFKQSDIDSLLKIEVPVEQGRAVLRKWKELQGSEATYENLLRACCEHDEVFTDTIEAIISVLNRRSTIDIESDKKRKVEGKVNKFIERTKELRAVLTEAVHCDYLEVVEQAVDKLENYFKRADPEINKYVPMGLNGLQMLDFCLVKLENAPEKYSDHRILMLALELGRTEIADFLLKQGAIVMASSEDGLTALHIACRDGRYEIAHLLLETAKKQKFCCLKGYDSDYEWIINQKGPQGWTPLMYAVKGGHVDTVEELMTSKFLQCDLTNKAGENVYHIMAATYNAECVAELLMKSNCPLDATDKDGNTALHVAHMKSNLPAQLAITNMWNEKGIDLETKNKAGKLPRELDGKAIAVPSEIKKLGNQSVEDYHQVLEEGTEKIPYCSILVLGRQKVGKTSLFRQLVGKPYDPNSQSTHGIDCTTVNTVDERNLDIMSEKWLAKRHFDTSQQFVDALAKNFMEKLLIRQDRSCQVSKTSLLQWLSEISFGQISADSMECQPEQQPQVSIGSRPKEKQQAKREHHNTVENSNGVRSSVAKGVEMLNPLQSSKIDEVIKHSQVYKKKEPSAILNILDFAGQKVYRPMHHCFISRQALYLIVFKIPDLLKYIDDQNKALYNPLDEIRYWIKSIHASIISWSLDADDDDENLKSLKRVLLIGTYRDAVDREDLKIIDKFIIHNLIMDHTQVYDSLIYTDDEQNNTGCKFYIPVENSIDIKAEPMNYLERSGTNLVQLKIKAMFKSLPSMKHEQSIKWLKFEENLRQHYHKIGKSAPIVRMEKVEEIARSSGISEKNQQEEALKFLHNTGKLIGTKYLPRRLLKGKSYHYQMVEDLIVLDTQWLMTAMKMIIELNTKYEKYSSEVAKYLRDDGVAYEGLFEACWDKLGKSSSSIKVGHFLNILQLYGLVYHFHDRKYVIPCKIPESIRDREVYKKLIDINPATFYIEFKPLLPEEIYHRLICLALANCKAKSPIPKNEDRLSTFSKRLCLFFRFNGTNWAFEMEEETQRLKIEVIVKEKKTLRNYIKFIHEKCLSKIIRESGWVRLSYCGGIEVVCDHCHVLNFYQCVEYKPESENVDCIGDEDGDYMEEEESSTLEECEMCTKEYDISMLDTKGYTSSSSTVSINDSYMGRSAPTMGDLMNRIKHQYCLADKIGTSWRYIGLQLGIEDDILDSFNEDYDDVKNKLRAVFRRWIDDACQLPNHSLYPLSWHGLNSILIDIGKSEHAKTYFKILLSL